MLSKPKYMLPGNLSQGAPILEPDENGDYKFSFALDGDEKIEDIQLEICTDVEHIVRTFEESSVKLLVLNSEEEKTIFSTIDESKIIDFNFENLDNNESALNFSIPYEDEFEIKFLNKTDEFILDDEEESEIDYSATLSQSYEINYDDDSSKYTMRRWFNHSKNKSYEIDDLFVFSLMGMNHKTDEDDFASSQFALIKKASFLFLANEKIIIKTIKENEKIKFLGKFKEKKIKFYLKDYVLSLGKPSYLPLEPSKVVSILENENGFDLGSSKTLEKLKLPYTIENEKGYFYVTLNPENTKQPYEYFYSDNTHLDNSITGYWNQKEFNRNDVIGFVFNLKNFLELKIEESLSGELKSQEVPLDSNLINITTSIKDFYFPKNYDGNYNFFTLFFNKENIYGLQQTSLKDWKNFFWKVKINNQINSDYIFFQVKNNEKEYKIYNDIVNNIFGVKNKGSFIDYDIIEYQYEIKNRKGIVYYKSPLIKSSNMQFAQLSLPPSIQDDNGGYSLYFTALNKDMRTIQLTEELPLSALNPAFDAAYSYNILTKEINIQLEKNGWETQNYIQNYTLMCCDEAKENYRIVKENISFEEIRNFSYYDTFNPYQKFYYFLVPVIKTWPAVMGDPYPQHSNFFYFENLPVDKWRLILTKEKKSDIIYSVDKVYDFYYNLVSGSMGNNAETTINTNFTSMPSVQKGFSNYWSGSLSALMGVCDEQGEFAQTIEQEKALEQLVLDQEHDKFLLDREGNIWQVEISAPLTIANQDGLIQVDKLIDLKTITINWVQVGSPTQIIFNFEE